ncbi:MAG: rRNA maturation RNase YbeY [Patescibacteria group bacterium]
MSKVNKIFQWHNLTAGGLVPPVFLNGIKKTINNFEKIVKVKLQDLSLVFVTPAVMRQLNRRYRRHDKVTDVLSFTYQPEPIIGELIICLDQAIKQAVRQKHNLDKELNLLLVHGLLHLAGYDHMKFKDRQVMRSLEKKILSRL